MKNKDTMSYADHVKKLGKEKLGQMSEDCDAKATRALKKPKPKRTYLTK